MTAASMSLGKSPALLLTTVQFILYPTSCAIPISGNAYCSFWSIQRANKLYHSNTKQNNKQKDKTNTRAKELGSWQHEGYKSPCAQSFRECQ